MRDHRFILESKHSAEAKPQSPKSFQPPNTKAWPLPRHAAAQAYARGMDIGGSGLHSLVTKSNASQRFRYQSWWRPVAMSRPPKTIIRPPIAAHVDAKRPMLIDGALLLLRQRLVSSEYQTVLAVTVASLHWPPATTIHSGPMNEAINGRSPGGKWASAGTVRIAAMTTSPSTSQSITAWNSGEGERNRSRVQLQWRMIERWPLAAKRSKIAFRLNNWSLSHRLRRQRFVTSTWQVQFTHR